MSRPYTGMLLSLLKLGFSTADLRALPLTMCLEFIGAHNEMAGAPEEGGTREATQADIQRMLA